MATSTGYRYFKARFLLSLDLDGGWWRVDADGLAEWSRCGRIWFPMTPECVYRTAEDIDAAVDRNILVEVDAPQPTQQRTRRGNSS